MVHIAIGNGAGSGRSHPQSGGSTCRSSTPRFACSSAGRSARSRRSSTSAPNAARGRAGKSAALLRVVVSGRGQRRAARGRRWSKAYCSEAYFHAAAENIQIHGGSGSPGSTPRTCTSSGEELRDLPRRPDVPPRAPPSASASEPAARLDPPIPERPSADRLHVRVRSTPTGVSAASARRKARASTSPSWCAASTPTSWSSLRRGGSSTVAVCSMTSRPPATASRRSTSRPSSRAVWSPSR